MGRVHSSGSLLSRSHASFPHKSMTKPSIYTSPPNRHSSNRTAMSAMVARTIIGSNAFLDPTTIGSRPHCDRVYPFLDPNSLPLLLLPGAPQPRLYLPVWYTRHRRLCVTHHTVQSACGLTLLTFVLTCLPQVRSDTGSTKLPRPPSVTSMRRARSTTPTRFQGSRSTTPPRFQRY